MLCDAGIRPLLSYGNLEPSGGSRTNASKSRSDGPNFREGPSCQELGAVDSRNCTPLGLGASSNGRDASTVGLFGSSTADTGESVFGSGRGAELRFDSPAPEFAELLGALLPLPAAPETDSFQPESDGRGERLAAGWTTEGRDGPDALLMGVNGS